MNAAKRANAVRSIRSQIFELESLDSFTPTVQATIRQLYQEADKRGGTDHLTALDLSCRFDSAHVDCQQVHDAASLLESIKSNFLGVEKSVIWAEHHSNTLWMVEPRHVLHGFHFGTAEDIEESAQKLAAPDADIHRRIEILSSCRRLHQRLNEGTIDPAMSYVISQPKTSTFADNVVSRLSFHCQQALKDAPNCDKSMTSAQKNRLLTLRSLSNPQSLAWGSLKEGITAARPAIDPNYPPEQWFNEEMRRFGSDLTAATKLLNTGLKEPSIFFGLNPMSYLA